jgi:succinoglycan biosynthesis protein ExoM
MNKNSAHISVCICTYKRPLYLVRLLNELEGQDTGGLFTYSIVVADNDHLQSARQVVSEFAAKAHIQTIYCVEPQQNIALARNKALQYATGDFIAFIDDDELPIKNWLLIMIKACHRYGADGILGPVKPRFEEEPPKWVLKGKFWERPTYKTGLIIDWDKCRTGNVLLRRRVINSAERAFNPEFPISEDSDFFMRMIEKGYVFVWSNEAIVYEIVPPMRCKRTVILRRALLRGSISINYPYFGAHVTAKSIIAIAAYTLILPFLIILSQHMFMIYLEKMFDHLGRILALLGFSSIKDRYVM